MFHHVSAYAEWMPNKEIDLTCRRRRRRGCCCCCCCGGGGGGGGFYCVFNNVASFAFHIVFSSA